MPPGNRLDMFRQQPSHGWHLQPNCRLLRLPAELRNKIYHFTLVNDNHEDVPIAQSDKLPHRIELRTMRMTVLSATCRQIQHESLSYFFRYATFTYILKLDEALHIDYRLHRTTKRWLEHASASRYKIHDIVLGFEAPTQTKSTGRSIFPERINALHIVDTQRATSRKITAYKLTWLDELYVKLRKRHQVKSSQAWEFTVEAVISLMELWAWMPTTRIGLATARWKMRGAWVARKMGMK